MKNVLEAVRRSGLRRLIVYPNTDRGHLGVIRAIESHRRDHRVASPLVGGDPVTVVRSLPRDEYLRLLLSAEVLVGNSSSGIIEAASAGTPSVNVGHRQAGRQRAGSSVIEAQESFDSILEAIKIARRKRPKRGQRTVYGDGLSGQRIARILARTKLTSKIRQKSMTY